MAPVEPWPALTGPCCKVVRHRWELDRARKFWEKRNVERPLVPTPPMLVDGFAFRCATNVSFFFSNRWFSGMTHLDCGVALANCELLELLEPIIFKGHRTLFQHPHKMGLENHGISKRKRPLERILYHFQQHGMQLQVRTPFSLKVRGEKYEK